MAAALFAVEVLLVVLVLEEVTLFAVEGVFVVLVVFCFEVLVVVFVFVVVVVVVVFLDGLAVFDATFWFWFEAFLAAAS